jgi:hypothetical protein
MARNFLKRRVQLLVVFTSSRLSLNGSSTVLRFKNEANALQFFGAIAGHTGASAFGADINGPA